jgi:hypothetical protein
VARRVPFHRSGKRMQLDVAKDILNYFLDHPGAVDSLEGIAMWRLMEEMLQRRIAETREAVEWLAGQGYLESIDRQSGDALYKFNDTRRAEALQLTGRDK